MTQFEPPRAGDAPKLAEPIRLWSDADLVEACLADDEAAWAEMVRRFGRLVFSIPRRYGFDREASEDVFQDVFAALHRQLDGMRRPEALPKWFITTTHRVCQRHRASDRIGRESASSLIDRESIPLDLVARWEREHLVRRGLLQLGRQCRDLLTALFSHSPTPTYDQIARDLSIPRGSLGPMRARCLERLADVLRRQEEQRDA